MDLLDLMVDPPIIRPVDPDGLVIQGEADETFECRPPGWRLAYPMARIELHKDKSGEWMWSVAYTLGSSQGSSYKVGPKWGKFARTRASALHWACDELRGKIEGKDHSDVLRIMTWMDTLG